MTLINKMHTASMRTAMPLRNGNVGGGAQPTVNLDELQNCWKTLQAKLMITNTQPLDDAAGLWGFLRSGMNTGNSRIQITPAIDQGDGKRYKLRRQYFPIQYQENLANYDINYCEVSGVEYSDMVDTVDIRFTHVGQPLKIDLARLLCKDETLAEYEMKRMAEHIRLFEVSFIHKIKALIANGLNHANKRYVGAMPGSNFRSEIMPWPLIKTNGEVNTDGLAWLEQVYMNAGLSQNKPYMIGGAKMNMLIKKLGYQRCNSCTGIDAAAANADISGMFTYDRDIGNLLGNKDAVLAIAPGALQVVTRANFKGDFAGDTADHRRFTFMLPRLGVEADMLWNRKCGKQISYSYQPMIEYDVIGYPDCWTKNPCHKELTDVFAFLPICSDSNICDMVVPGCDTRVAPNQMHNESCVDGLMQSCPVPCSASFVSTKGAKCLHKFMGVIAGVDAIEINGMQFRLPTSYTAADFGADPALHDQFVTELGNALPGMSSVLHSAFVAGESTLVLDLDCEVVSVKLLQSGEVTATFMPEGSKEYVCYTANIAPSTGAQINNIKWELPGGLILEGIPGTVLNQPGFVGSLQKFCVEEEFAGDADTEVTLSITDTVACQRSFKGINWYCPPTYAPGVDIGDDEPTPTVCTAQTTLPVGVKIYRIFDANGTEYSFPSAVTPDEPTVIAAIQAGLDSAGVTATITYDGATGVVTLSEYDSLIQSIGDSAGGIHEFVETCV